MLLSVLCSYTVMGQDEGLEAFHNEHAIQKEQFLDLTTKLPTMVKQGKYFEGLQLVESVENTSGIISARQRAYLHTYKADFYSLLGIWDLAEQYFQQTLPVVNQLKDVNLRVELLIKLSEVKRRIPGQGMEAYHLLQKTYDIIIQNDMDNYYLAFFHERLAGTFETHDVGSYFNLTTPDSVVTHARKAIYYAQLAEAKTQLASAYNLIGAMKWQTREYDSSFYYFDRAEKIFTEDEDYRGKHLVLLNKAITYGFSGDFENERILLDSAHRNSRNESWQYERKEVLYRLATNEENRGNFEQSVAWIHKFNQLKDSLTEQRYNQRTEVVRSAFELEKKQNQINQKMEEIRRQELEKSQLIKLLFLAAFIVVLLVLMTIVMFRLKRRTNEQSKSISSQNLTLSAANKEKEILLQELNHRVKNNLSLLAGLMDIKMSKVSNVETEKSLDDIKQRIMAMATIHRHIYENENNGIISCKEPMEELIKHQQDLLPIELRQSISFVIEDKELKMPQLITLLMICNELLTNALKHVIRSQDDWVKISFSYTTGAYHLSVVDSGKGIPENYDKTSSMGLHLISLLTKKLKGSLNRTVNNNGHKFELEFPG